MVATYICLSRHRTAIYVDSWECITSTRPTSWSTRNQNVMLGSARHDRQLIFLRTSSRRLSTCSNWQLMWLCSRLSHHLWYHLHAATTVQLEASKTKRQHQTYKIFTLQLLWWCKWRRSEMGISISFTLKTSKAPPQRLAHIFTLLTFLRSCRWPVIGLFWPDNDLWHAVVVPTAMPVHVRPPLSE